MLGLGAPCAPIVVVTPALPQQHWDGLGPQIYLHIPMIDILITPDRHHQVGLEYRFGTARSDICSPRFGPDLHFIEAIETGARSLIKLDVHLSDSKRVREEGDRWFMESSTGSIVNAG